MFDVFTLFFIGGIINSSVNWFTNFFGVVVAHLVWDCHCYWVAYLFWDSVAFGFITSSVLSYRVCLADTFGNIFTRGCVGSNVNGMTFDDRFRVNIRSRSRMVCTIAVAKTMAIWMTMSNTFSSSPTPSFSFSLGFGKSRRQKNAQGKKNLHFSSQNKF